MAAREAAWLGPAIAPALLIPHRPPSSPSYNRLQPLICCGAVGGRGRAGMLSLCIQRLHGQMDEPKLWALTRLHFSENVAQRDVHEALRLLQTSKYLICSDDRQRSSLDMISDIYSILRDEAARTSSMDVKYGHSLNVISSKGCSEAQLKECLEEYAGVCILEGHITKQVFHTMVLSTGIDVDHFDSVYGTPLHVAANDVQDGAMNILLEHHADVSHHLLVLLAVQKEIQVC